MQVARYRMHVSTRPFVAFTIVIVGLSVSGRARTEPSSSAAPSASSTGPAEAPAAASGRPSEGPGATEIVVQGRPQARSASETVRDSRVVTAAPHRTGGDVLLVVPGVFITQHSGQGKAYQVFFRGFDAVHGQDVEFDVGGVPVNEVSNLHGQGYADLHFVMPEVVAEVRSTPGTYSPRQGDFAVAGSIGFGLGYAEPGITTKATVGSFGERRVFLAYHPADTPAESFGAFEAQATDGFGPSRAARRTSAIAQHVVRLDRGVSLRVLTQAYASRFDSAGVLRREDLDASLDRFATYDPRQGGGSTRASLLVDLSGTLPNAADPAASSEWSIAPWLVYRSLTLRQNYTGFLQHPADGDSTEQQNETITLGGRATYRKGLGWWSSSDAVEVGLGMRTDFIDQAQRALGSVDDRVLGTDVAAKIRAVDATGWLDLSVKPCRRCRVRAGVRVDGLSYGTTEDASGATDTSGAGSTSTTRGAGQARSAMGVHVGPKLTLDYRLHGGLHLVGSYGEGFRSPQARSLGEGERTPFTTVQSIELGLRHRQDRWLSGSLAAFNTWLSDDLVFDPATARNERVPGTTRTGVALEYLIAPTAWFISSGSATYTRAVFGQSGNGFHTGDAVPYVPQLVVRHDLSFTPTVTTMLGRPVRGRLGGALTGLVGRPLPYGRWGSDVLLIDASVGARWRALELSVDVFNLLDAGWFDGQFVYASNWSRGATPRLVPTEHVTVGAPRSVLASLTVFL